MRQLIIEFQGCTNNSNKDNGTPSRMIESGWNKAIFLTLCTPLMSPLYTVTTTITTLLLIANKPDKTASSDFKKRTDYAVAFGSLRAYIILVVWPKHDEWSALSCGPLFIHLSDTRLHFARCKNDVRASHGDTRPECVLIWMCVWLLV